MNDSRFKKLIIKRKGWIKSNIDNEFDVGPILVGPYTKTSHFIYEILLYECFIYYFNIAL